MKTLLIVLMLLTGCAQKETIKEPANVHRTTTIYRYLSGLCVPCDDHSAALRKALNSRDRWKRYAERLEKLPGATINDPDQQLETSPEHD